MKKIAVVTNAQPNSGVGSRAYELFSRMKKNSDFDISLVMLDGKSGTIATTPTTAPHGAVPSPLSKREKALRKLPGILGSKSISWIRLAKKLPKFDGYDITNQTLSFMANSRKPSIVTVHDIIELTDPQSKIAYYINQYLLGGIKNAGHIVTVSEYVKQQIMHHIGISSEKISVIPNGVSDAFMPVKDFRKTIGYHELVKKLRLPADSPVVLSVGSEHPRKNMTTTLKTIALLKKTYPDILLIKIGEPGLLSGRRDLLNMVDELGLQENIRILGKVSDEILMQAYHTADALLMPSYFEGFGMPVLEAMASGCPVVCSSATSLPEVVGDAGIMCDADDVDGFAGAISELFESGGIKEAFITKGLAQAKKFSWDDSAKKTMDVYNEYL